MHYSQPTADARQIIRTLRVMRGFASDRALAAAAGVNQPTLARYLAGTSETMEVGNFMAIAHTLGVTISELLGEVLGAFGFEVYAGGAVGFSFCTLSLQPPANFRVPRGFFQRLHLLLQPLDLPLQFLQPLGSRFATASGAR